MSTNDSDFVSSLQSQIDSLQIRVKELEAANAKLLSQLTDRNDHEIEKKLHGSDDKHMKSKNGNTKTEEKIQKMPGYHSMLIKHSKRYVALTVMYFGKSFRGFFGDDMTMLRALQNLNFACRFYGFSSDGQMDPTVESEIFRALEKTRLLVGDKKESQYSRCGRTDKGVSSVGQVIALFLRSNLQVSGTNNRNAGEIFSEEPHEGEIDYVKVLNRVLPNDIRILGWCPVPFDFHARFSCLSREYKYFFWRENLNIQDMESAAKKFLGEHDFRNFCKMDAANVHNYRRQITLFEMSPTNVRYDDNQLWVIKIKGTAFLWHQVRCMVAVLFMVGKGLESPDVIEILLDTNRTPRKPQYIMAAEVPLVLQSCEFEDIRFMCSSDAGEALRLHLVNECQIYQLHAAIFHEAILNCVSPSDDQNLQHYGGTKKKASHVPLLSRPTEPSYEERRAKFNST